VSTEGDAFFAVFPLALKAVSAAAQAQRALAAGPWPEGRTVNIRMPMRCSISMRIIPILAKTSPMACWLMNFNI
jgi:class 3 adenylate cyclase